jgi:micrococcal nuclease
MYTYKAVVVRIVDGDTLDADVDLGFYMKTRQRFRLARIDTPERGEEGFTEATDRVKELCPVGSTIVIGTEKTGGFGRWLAEVTYSKDEQPRNLSDQLLMEGHAKLYKK